MLCSTAGRSCSFRTGLRCAASRSWAISGSNSPASRTAWSTGSRRSGSYPRSSHGSCACSCRPARLALKSWAICWSGIRSSASVPAKAGTRPRHEDDIMSSEAADLAHRLARDAEAVCRYYLSNGRRQGRYWLVGDVANTPGRSLFVRLKGPDSGKGRVGKWTDAATGQHGDLLDLIAMNRRLDRLRDVLDEARTFLSLPRPERKPDRREQQSP